MNIRKWTTPIILAIGLTGLVGLAGDPAHSQTPGQCGPRAKVLEQLNAKRKYTRHAIGMFGTANKNMMEVYTNKTGKWIMLMTDVRKLTCVVAYGRDLEFIVSKEIIGSGA